MGGFVDFLKLMYNHERPPTRRVSANGYLSNKFPIHSGVAQGCPLSPLLFLLVAETLKICMELENVEGIKIGDKSYEISQFADDTTGLLKGLSEIPKVERAIERWGKLTAMKENKAKREGVIIGNITLEEARRKYPNIKWAEEGKGAKCLGIQVGYKIDRNLNWEDKIQKVRQLAHKWTALVAMSKEGRNSIVQSCYLGRFRYYLYSYEMSKKHVKQIEKDQNYLIWKRDPDMRVSDEEKKFRRWIPKQSENRPKCKGGAGIMSWNRHSQAFYADWIKRYLHPGYAHWKEVWDHILLIDDDGLERYPQRRAILISNLTKADKIRILKTIPKQCKYIKTCIKAFWSMDIKQDTTVDIDRGILGEPLYGNYRFHNIWNITTAAWWHNVMEVSCIGDLLDKDTGNPYDNNQWKQFLKREIGSFQNIHAQIHKKRRISNKVNNNKIQYRIKQVNRMTHALRSNGILRIIPPKNNNIIENEIVSFSKEGEEIIYCEYRNNIFHELWADNMAVLQETGKTFTPTQEYTMEKTTFITNVKEEHEMQSSDAHEYYKEIPRIIGPISTSYPLDKGWIIHKTKCNLGEININKMTKKSGKIRDAPPTCQIAWQKRFRGIRFKKWNNLWRASSTFFTRETCGAASAQ